MFVDWCGLLFCCGCVCLFAWGCYLLFGCSVVMIYCVLFLMFCFLGLWCYLILLFFVCLVCLTVTNLTVAFSFCVVCLFDLCVYCCLGVWVYFLIALGFYWLIGYSLLRLIYLWVVFCLFIKLTVICSGWLWVVKVFDFKWVNGFVVIFILDGFVFWVVGVYLFSYLLLVWMDLLVVVYCVCWCLLIACLYVFYFTGLRLIY